MQIVDVPGVGEVEFPDEMGDADIVAAVKRLASPQLAAAHSPGAEVPGAVPPKPTVGESAVRGGLQGLSMGWGDEVAATVDAALPGFLRNSVSDEAVGQGQTFGERRENARGYYRGRNAAAEEANPGTYLAGQVAGAVAPTLVGAAPLTGARAAATAAGQGLAQGAGYSEREGLGLAGDTALGGALGLAGYGAGQVLGKGVSAATRKGRDLVQSGTARAGAQAAGEVAEGLQSAAGKLGGEVQKGSRQVENLMRLEASMTPQQRELYRSLSEAPVFHGSPVKGIRALEVGEARSGRALGPGVYATTAPTEAASYAGATGSIYRLRAPGPVLDLAAPLAEQGAVAEAARAALQRAGGGQSLVPAVQQTGFDLYRELSASLGREGAAKALQDAGVHGLAEGTKRVFFDPGRLGIMAELPDYAAAKALADQAQIIPHLQQSVAQSTLNALPSQAGTIAARQAELAALQQAAPQTAATRTAELLKPQVKADTKTFLKAYAEPVAWALGAQQLGSAIGLDPAQQGVLAGAAGMVGGRTRAGKALWTRLNRPAHQAAAGKLLQRAATRTDKVVGPLLRAGVPAAAIPALLSSHEEN